MHTVYNNTEDDSPDFKDLVGRIDDLPYESQLQICTYLVKKIGLSWFDDFKRLAEVLPWGWQKRFVEYYNKRETPKIAPNTITNLIKGNTIRINKKLFKHLVKFASIELEEQLEAKNAIIDLMEKHKK